MTKQALFWWCKNKISEIVLAEASMDGIFRITRFQDLTNQVLQTEDRWTVEIDKQRQIYDGEVSREKSSLVFFG